MHSTSSSATGITAGGVVSQVGSMVKYFLWGETDEPPQKTPEEIRAEKKREISLKKRRLDLRIDRELENLVADTKKKQKELENATKEGKDVAFKRRIAKNIVMNERKMNQLKSDKDRLNTREVKSIHMQIQSQVIAEAFNEILEMEAEMNGVGNTIQMSAKIKSMTRKQKILSGQMHKINSNIREFDKELRKEEELDREAEEEDMEEEEDDQEISEEVERLLDMEILKDFEAKTQGGQTVYNLPSVPVSSLPS